MDTKKQEGSKIAEALKEKETTAVEAEEGAADMIKKLEEALAAKTAEANANWDKYVRERADLENYRKRVQRDKEEHLKFCHEALVLEILPVIDGMDRALTHASEESLSAVIEGIDLTRSMLLAALKKFGVTPIEAKGTVFDPAFHQAMCQIETVDSPPNTVIEEYQKGYLLNDRLLRAAMVSVAVAPKN